MDRCCKKCKQVKNLEDFVTYTNKHGKQHRFTCKRCNADTMKRYRADYKERVAKAKTKWRRANLAKDCAWVMLRKARKLRACPKWADLQAIERFYENCSKGYEVDHIIPLAAETMSGLHILNNLQYLPASENRKKWRHVNERDLTQFPSCHIR